MDATLETIEGRATDYIGLTTEIVAAYVSNNPVRPADMPDLLTSMHAALASLGHAIAPTVPTAEKPTPAQIRKSITPDALISFIDGRPYKTLKRHLGGNGMTIEQYRERYGLSRDYPATAANYSAQRSALAKSLGLGNQRRTDASSKPEPVAAADAASAKPRKVGRPRKAKVATEA